MRTFNKAYLNTYLFYEGKNPSIQVLFPSDWSSYPTDLAEPSYGLSSENTFRPLTHVQRSGILTALRMWENYVQFNFVTAPTSDGKSIKFGLTSLNAGTEGIGFYPKWPWKPALQGNVFFNSQMVGDALFTPSSGQANLMGRSSFRLALHETGHALGLGHVGGTREPSFGAPLPEREQNALFSVMAYDLYPSPQLRYPITPMLYDIAQLQEQYGENTAYNAGATTYIFTDSTTPFVDQGITARPDEAVMTLWDGDGTRANGSDKIDASAVTSSVKIDLNPGEFSAIGTDYALNGIGAYNVGIAFNTLIEDAVGSSSNDRLIGNAVANKLDGGAGNDDLDGGGGNDTLMGGAGSGRDTLAGGAGNDYLDAGAGDDFLVGDYIYTVGRSGNDTLVGGTGFDTYYFNTPCCALYGFKSTIIDADGQGEIRYTFGNIGGYTPILKPTFTPGIYTDQYDQTNYLVSGKNLYITVHGAYGANAAGGITVKNWHNGDLGIVIPGTSPVPSWRTESPLVLDLGGGIQATSVRDGVYFDLDADGFAERTSWINPGQALLVRDIDHDGKITSGRELFGTATSLPGGGVATDGFQALAALDSNGNGVMDAGDAAYFELGVWNINNGTGGVITPLWQSQWQIVTRSRDTSLVDANGNEAKKIGSYTDANGNVKMIADVWFQTNRSTSIAQRGQAVPEDVAALPDLPGGGTLQSLHHAMSSDASLKALVQQFVAAATPEQAATLMQSILWRWTGADARASNSRGTAIPDARWLYMLEAFNGQSYVQRIGVQAGSPNPGPVAAAEIYESCRQLFEAQYAQLAAQSRLASLHDALDANWNTQSQSFRVEYGQAAVAIVAAAQANRPAGLSLIKEFVRSLAGTSQLNADAVQQLQQGLATLGADAVALVTAPPAIAIAAVPTEVLRLGNDSLPGGAGDDSLYGGAGDDALSGVTGNDQLSGGTGGDTLDGGAGNDVLSGNDGADVYLFNSGFGQDTIYNSDNDAIGVNADELRFGAGLTPATTAASRTGADLQLRAFNSSDSVVVKDYFAQDTGSPAAIERISFSDATVWDRTRVRSLVLASTAGADVLTGYASDDVLSGGAGNDTLVGNDGADTLEGGVGNDSLQGGAGDNVYVFGRGDGQDTILADWDIDGRRLGTLQFNAGVSAADVTTQYIGSDLVLSINGTADSVTIKNFLSPDTWWDRFNPVRQIIFADGTSLPLGSLGGESRILGPAADSYSGTTMSDTVHGGSGFDTLMGLEGDDLLFGGEGNDAIVGGNGNDMLLGGSGWDELEGGEGNDTLNVGEGGGYAIGGEGDDSYVWAIGAGDMNIYNDDWSTTLSGTVFAGAGILPGDVSVRLGFRELTLKVGQTGDSLHLINRTSDAGYQFNAPGLSINRVVFTDGTVWTDESLRELQLRSTPSNDWISGYEGGDVISTGAGNDHASGGAGNDSLFGEEGNDTLFGETENDQLFGGDGTDNLYGGYGDDTLDGGAGNDEYAGDWGADTFVWGPGSGQDRIIGQGEATQGDDQLVVSALPADVWVSKSGYTITLGVEGTADQVVLEDELFPEGPNRYGPTVESVVFADGARWDVADLLRKSLLGSPYDDYDISGSEADDYLDGRGGRDVLTGAQGVDTLHGGTGDDWMDGGAGDDTYLIGSNEGNDTIQNGTDGGTDTVQFEGGIVLFDLQAVRWGDTAFIAIAGGRDGTVGLEDYYLRLSDPTGTRYRFKFADGSLLEAAAVQQMLGAPRLNLAPTVGVAMSAARAKQGSAFQYAIPSNAVTDANPSDPITYNMSSLPNWLSFDTATRTLTGTPTSATASVGLTGVSWWATDPFGAGVEVSLSINVGAPNRVPVLAQAIADTTVAVSGTFSYSVSTNTFSDPDAGDVLTLSATQMDGTALPSWLSFSAGTRTFSGSASTTGTTVVRVTASDGWGGSVSDDFVITSAVQNLTLSGTANADTLTGGAGNDSLSGLAGNDRLVGLAGNDVLDGGAGVDTLIGGAGDDTYVVDSSSDVVTESAAEGLDLVKSTVTYVLSTNVENLLLTGTTTIGATGNTSDNVLTGNSGNNTLTGLAGNDTLDGGLGNDTMVGGAGNDTYVVNVSSDVVTEAANEGTDTVQSAVTLTLANNVENLTLTGTSVIDGTGNTLGNVLTGNAVNNTVNGGAGTDTMIGGAGNDTYVVDSATDVVTELAGEGTDLVQTGVTFTLSANVENLTITGTAVVNGTGNLLDNVLTGNSANNNLAGGAGNDTMLGGVGNDTYVVNVATDVITELTDEGIDTAMAAATYTLGNYVENLTLTGTSAINGTGNGLDNVLTGNGANNSLTGAAGNDTLDGGLGNDTMIGGAGNDVYMVNVSTDVVTELANEGTDTVQSAVTLTLGINVENLTLTGSSAVNGTGNTLNNLLLGNAGVNVLTGAAGDDTYDGAGGNDTFTDTSTTSNDTYRWGIGSGLDTLTDSGGSLDHVDLFAGITKSQLKFVRSGNNLQMSVTGQTDKLTVNNWYLSTANQIEEFRLSDGNKVLASDIQSMVSAMAVFSSDASAAFEDGRVTILPARRFADLLMPSAMA